MNTSDMISTLPVDATVPTSKELFALNAISPATEKNIITFLKPFLITMVIFIIFSLPFFDNFVKGVLPSMMNLPVVYIVAKAFIFTLVVYLAMKK